ncbi:MAG: hypothetical protein AAF581_14295 [Planctomycetota bacterium]
MNESRQGRLSVSETCVEAWELARKRYGVFVGAGFLCALLQSPQALMSSWPGVPAWLSSQYTIAATTVFVFGPLTAGALLVAAHSAYRPTPMLRLFAGYRRYLPIVGIQLLLMILSLPTLLMMPSEAELMEGQFGTFWIVIMCQFCVDLVLQPRLILAYPLCLDKELGSLAALRLSWQITRGSGFRLSLIYILTSVVLAVSAILLLLPLFLFGVPFVFGVVGVLYLRFVGGESDELVEVFS